MKTNLFLFAVVGLLLLFSPACLKKEDSTVMKLKDYRQYGGHTYAITTAKRSWDESRKYAEEQGGYLVIIDSMEENDFIRETYRVPLNTSEDILWIGLSDAEEEGVFRWVNGELPGFTNWSYGEPNNDYGTQDYGHMYADGTWDDVEVKDCYAVIEFDQ